MNFIVLFSLLTFCLFSPGAERKPALSEVQMGISDIKNKYQVLEDQLAKLRNELDTLKVQPHTEAVPALFSLSNQTFVRGGFSLIFPRDLTLGGNVVDDGLGAYIGVGQYLGKNHILELTFDYDLYPSLTMRYRFEIHPRTPPIAISPIIGYKIKVASLPPADPFITRPDDIKSSFAVFGINLGLPIAGSIFNIEFIYLLNNQAFFFTNLGINFFI
jgi:hypothetical protein